MCSDPLSPNLHEPFVRALTLHERVIRAYIRGSGINRSEDVDEIMQEVSLTAWKKFEQLEDLDKFPVWACVIARYEVLHFRRKCATDRLVLSDKVFDLLADESLQQVSCGSKEKRLNQLQICLKKLTPSNRELVMTAYQPGISIDSLASRLGKKSNTLYQQLWRIRRALERCVDKAIQEDFAS